MGMCLSLKIIGIQPSVIIMVCMELYIYMFWGVGGWHLFACAAILCLFILQSQSQRRVSTIGSTDRG